MVSIYKTTLALIKSYAESAVNEMKTRLRNAKRRKHTGAVASGNLINTIKATTKETTTGKKFTYETIFTQKDGGRVVEIEDGYGQYVDSGRKPGTPPPVSKIKKWCSYKKIDTKFAYPIAKNIGKYGIPRTNFYSIPVGKFNSDIKKSRVADAIAYDIDVELQKQLDKA